MRNRGTKVKKSGTEIRKKIHFENKICFVSNAS